MTAAYLRRGLAAGLLAGLLAGFFGFVFGEPLMDRAIQHESHAGHGHEHEIFSRAEQKAGLILGTTLYGASVGGIFGLLFAYFRRGIPPRSEWKRSLALAGALFAGAVLLPFLKYPPNPPGVAADPSTLAKRTLAYLTMMALGTLATGIAWRSARVVGIASPSLCALAGGVVLIFLWAFLYLAMPGFEAGSVGLSEDLILDFRLASLGTQAVLWAGIALFFAFLNGRRREAS